MNIKAFLIFAFLLLNTGTYAEDYEPLVAQVLYPTVLSCNGLSHDVVNNFNQALHDALMSGKHVIPFKQPEVNTNFLVTKKPATSTDGFYVDFDLGTCSSLDLSTGQATCAVENLKMTYGKPKPYNQTVYLDDVVLNMIYSQEQVDEMMAALNSTLQQYPDMTVAIDGWGSFKWDTKYKKIKFKGVDLTAVYEPIPQPELFACGSSGIGSTEFEVEITDSSYDISPHKDFDYGFVMDFNLGDGYVDVSLRSRHISDEVCGEYDCYYEYTEFYSNPVRVDSLGTVYTIAWELDNFDYSDVSVSISFVLKGIDGTEELNWDDAVTPGTYTRSSYMNEYW